MFRAVALAATPTARQLPKAASSCSTGLGAVSVPPRPGGSSDGRASKFRMAADERKAPSQVTDADQTVAALEGSSTIAWARAPTASISTALSWVVVTDMGM